LRGEKRGGNSKVDEGKCQPESKHGSRIQRRSVVDGKRSSRSARFAISKLAG
jgi:hypothetical protein